MADRTKKSAGGLAVDWYPAKTLGPSTAHDLSKKTERVCSARDESGALVKVLLRSEILMLAAVFHDRGFRLWAIVNARMNQVRYRSHATYSRQPRQVRKEATVTGSCVCSEVPVPDLFLNKKPSVVSEPLITGFYTPLPLFSQELSSRTIYRNKKLRLNVRGER